MLFTQVVADLACCEHGSHKSGTAMGQHGCGRRCARGAARTEVTPAGGEVDP